MFTFDMEMASLGSYLCCLESRSSAAPLVFTLMTLYCAYLRQLLQSRLTMYCNLISMKKGTGWLESLSETNLTLRYGVNIYHIR